MFFMARLAVIYILLILIPNFSFSQNEVNLGSTDIVEHYHANEDGTYLLQVSKTIKPNIDLTDFSIEIPYNSLFQQVKVNEFYKVNISGDTNRLPIEFIKNTRLNSETDSNSGLYHLHNLVISTGRLLSNEKFIIKYEVLTKKGLYPFYMGFRKISDYYFAVDNLIYKVSLPAEKQLNYKVINSNVEPEIISTNGITTYTFNFGNLQPVTPNKFAPHPAKYLPCLIWSDENSFARKYKRYVMQPAFKFAIDDSMMQLSKKLKEESKDDTEYILKINDFISQNYSLVEVPMRVSGYWFRPPIDVFYDRTATQIEIATLMCALLQNSGVYAVPVLVGEKELVSSEVPNFDVYENIYVRIFRLPQDYVYLNPGKKAVYNLKYDLNGKTIVPILPQIQQLQYVTENNPDSYSILGGEFEMSEKGILTGTAIIEKNEIFNPFFELKKENNLKEFLLENGIDSRDNHITKFNEKELSVTTQALKIKLTRFENEFFESYLLPNNLNNELISLYTHLQNQEINIVTINPQTLICKYNIRLKNGIKTERNNLSVEKKNSIGSVEIRINSTKRKVEVYRKLKIEKYLLVNSQIKELKELLDIWYDVKYSELIVN